MHALYWILTLSTAITLSKYLAGRQYVDVLPFFTNETLGYPLAVLGPAAFIPELVDIFGISHDPVGVAVNLHRQGDHK